MAMIVVMLPCFLVAMYEKHGQPLEVVVKNIIQTKLTRPKVRPYQTENLYEEYGRDAAINDGGSFTEQGYIHPVTFYCSPFFLDMSIQFH